MALTATNSILVSAFPSIDTELFEYIEGLILFTVFRNIESFKFLVMFVKIVPTNLIDLLLYTSYDLLVLFYALTSEFVKHVLAECLLRIIQLAISH